MILEYDYYCITKKNNQSHLSLSVADRVSLGLVSQGLALFEDFRRVPLAPPLRYGVHRIRFAMLRERGSTAQLQYYAVETIYFVD